MSKPWSAVALVLLLLGTVAVMAGRAAVRAFLVGDPIDVGTAHFVGFIGAGGLVVGIGVHMIDHRYGDSEPGGELPEPREGISRWTRR